MTGPVKFLLIAVACVTLFLGYSYHAGLWTLTEAGLSAASRTTPYWDFNNLWSGSKMVLAGDAHLLFDAEGYRARLREMAGADLPDHEWSYPPNILLIGAMLAQLPQLPAYLIWTFGTITAWFASVRLLKLPPLMTAAIVVSPAIIWNALYGQNGALTAALLLGGLALSDKRPWFAGVLFGLLTIKPHLGLLIPFILMAQGNWRAIIGAAVTVIAMVLLTGALFGFDLWLGFLTQTRPLMTSIMHAPWGEGYHANSATGFAFMRSLGAGIGAAYAAQAAVSLSCLIIAVALWRKAAQYDRTILIALTLCLVFLAAPYGYTYEMAGVSLACAVLFLRRPSLTYALPLALLWLWPLINHFSVQAVDVALTTPLVILLCVALTAELRRPKPASSPAPA